MEEKNQKLLAIILVLAVIALGVYKLFFSNRTKKENIDTKTISVVTNNSDFFTVAGCISKYFIYLNGADTNNLLVLLSDDYKKNNNIDSSNLYSYVDKIKNFYTFIPKEMRKQRVSKNKYKYYVYGLLEKGTEDTTHTREDYYIIVILDESNMTFAIEPYDGEIYKK